MSAALGRWVLVAFGCVSASSGQPPSRPGKQIKDSFSDISSSGFGIPQPLINGSPSFIRYQDPPPELLKRDCLANGTNYCFGDTANYCAACGTCCSSTASKWCCPSNGICCGSACCASGQTCKDGQCYLPPVTITVQSTVIATTVTHQLTLTDTVARVVIESSTINSVVEVTTTNTDATQTDYTYVTATVIERRWLPGPTPVARLSPCDSEDDDEGGRAPVAEQLDAEQATLIRRQSQAPAESGKVLSGSGATSTVTNVVSKTSDVTSTVHNTITTDSTSTVLTTIFQTNTKVLNAKATVQATSTLTFTSRPPVTSTFTQIANPAAASTTTSSTAAATLVPTPPNNAAPGLPTPTIIGIAVGSTVFALAACVAVFALVKWRQRKARLAQEYEDAAFGLGGQHAYNEPGRGYAHMRQPTMPRVVPAAVPKRMSHARTASGFTGSTAVGAGADAQGAAGLKNQRASAVASVASSYGDSAAYQYHPVEVPADEIQRYEVEANSPSPTPRFEGGMNWTPQPSPPLPQGPQAGGGQGYYRDF